MSKMTKEQMRAYQRDRREKLRKAPPVKKGSCPSGVVPAPRVDMDIIRLEGRMAALEARVSLLEVVDKVVRAPVRAVGTEEKGLFQRVVEEKERRVRG